MNLFCPIPGLIAVVLILAQSMNAAPQPSALPVYVEQAQTAPPPPRPPQLASARLGQADPSASLPAGIEIPANLKQHCQRDKAWCDKFIKQLVAKQKALAGSTMQAAIKPEQLTDCVQNPHCLDNIVNDNI